MGTANFRTQTDFDLYLYDGSATEEDIKSYRDEVLEDFENDEESEDYVDDDTLYRRLTDYNYEFVVDNFSYELDEVLKELKRELQFYTIELKDGYYTGLQFYVRMNDTLYNYGDDVEDVLNYIDNEDTKYYYDMCYSQFKVKLLSEVKYINKKVLPLLAKYTGFEQYSCVGVFSNGEAVYRKAA